MAQDPSAPESTQKRGCRRLFLIGGVIILLLCAYRICSFLSPGPLEIGPETTVISRPLLPDGRVDYLTAMDERMRNGVTPDNNAAVLLIRAFGPKVIEAEHRREYFRLLGVPEPSLEGDYVITQMDWVDRHFPENVILSDWQQRAYEEFDEARRRPWSREDFPEASAWLEAK